jgi:hypothetical protein
MSTPLPPQPAKLVIGLFTKAKEHADNVCNRLQNKYGPIDLRSRWFDFSYTDYYYREMGAPLFRRVFSFERFIAQKQLAEIKCHTNAIETVFSQQGRRLFNIDPGYLLYERFVLATGKNYTHRIYIGKGIYADLTLIYQQGAYQPLPWTYPDYASSQIGEFLLKVRRKYGADLKSPNKELDRCSKA